MSASRRRETLLNFGLGGIEGRARNLVGGRGRVRRRLQLGAGVLRDVGEIGRQSWRPNGRRFGLGSIVVWLGMALVLEDVRLTRINPCLFRWASKHGQRGWHLPRPAGGHCAQRRHRGYAALRHDYRQGRQDGRVGASKRFDSGLATGLHHRQAKAADVLPGASQRSQLEGAAPGRPFRLPALWRLQEWNKRLDHTVGPGTEMLAPLTTRLTGALLAIVTGS